MKTYSRARRIVMAGFLLLFIIQLAKINLIAGSLTGSVAFSYIRLLDPFAYLESLAASRDFVSHAFWSVLPVIVLYMLLGRAFCGWVCPMDYLFELIERIRNKIIRLSWSNIQLPKISGYIIALCLLIASAIIGVPVFTNYLSHLTNLYRSITAGYFALAGLPVEMSLFIYSLSAVFILFLLEIFFPRLWCKNLCPVGKTYGLFNKFSLLRLTTLKDTCQHCDACNKSCYMGIDISVKTEQLTLRDTDCILCGRCVESCAEKGKTLKLTFKKEK